jgi:hypothetical protein
MHGVPVCDRRRTSLFPAEVTVRLTLIIPTTLSLIVGFCPLIVHLWSVKYGF